MSTWLIIFLLFILPVLPGLIKAVPKVYRFYIFTAVVISSVIIVWTEQWPLSKLGLDVQNLSHGLWAYATFTLVSLVFIVCLASILRLKPGPTWSDQKYYILIVILLSMGQEFLYRGFLMPELETVFQNGLLVVAINALLFSFIHAIYPNKLVNLPLNFLGGLCFAGLYYFYPNLLLISISHVILNFASDYFGMFSFNKKLLPNK